MKPELVIALDTDIKKAKRIVDIATKLHFNLFKVGHLLFDTTPEIIKYITGKGGNVLLDLKFHDIPSVISKAINGILKEYKIWGITVHSLGGKNLLKEIVDTVSKNNFNIVIFAVTILTSLEEKDLKLLGFKTGMKKTILNLAKLAKNSGVNGVVCSPKEVEMIKKTCGKNFLTLVPGVSILSKNTDQKRADTLEKVISSGADYIVVGRNIYDSHEPENILYFLRNLFNK